MTEIQSLLFANQDIKYRDFHAKLIPTVNPEIVIGVRTPILKKLAKELIKSGQAKKFIEQLPHEYYEENQLHAFILNNEKDYDVLITEVNRFLPYVNNWATCDQLRPVLFKKHTDLIENIRGWITSEHEYTVRFAIGMLLSYYLDAHFSVEYLDLVASVEREEYYIKMMVAWYFATALTKQYEQTLPYIEERRLDVWTHNKAIQKARESLRISKDVKEYLNTLKIKK